MHEGSEAERFGIWKSNHAFIEAHNAKADAGEVSFWLALNRFGDLTNDEYRAGLLSKRSSAARSPTEPSPPLQQGAAPDSFSWFEQGVVPPVKDQGEWGHSDHIACIDRIVHRRI